MKALTLTSLAAALFAVVHFAHAQEAPQMPQPAKEHAWLQKFAGTWDYEVEIFMEPGKPPLKAKGTEVARMIGGFWVVGEGHGDMGGMTFINLITFGYDPAKKKYVGTGIDSGSSTLWQYEGTVDAFRTCLRSSGFTPKSRLVSSFNAKFGKSGNIGGAVSVFGCR